MAAASAGTIQSGGVPVLVPGAITTAKSASEVAAGVAAAAATPGSAGVLGSQGNNRLKFYASNNTDIATVVGGIGSAVNSSASGNSGHHLQQNYSQQSGIPNLVSGWKRIVVNSEIIYISPTGAVLRNLGQVKDYLLSTGTCKCGLPCPLRPELLFEFDTKIPNLPLQILIESGIPRTSCIHQIKLLENQDIIKRDVVATKQSKLSSGDLSKNYDRNEANTKNVISNNNAYQIKSSATIRAAANENSNRTIDNSITLDKAITTGSPVTVTGTPAQSLITVGNKSLKQQSVNVKQQIQQQQQPQSIIVDSEQQIRNLKRQLSENNNMLYDQQLSQPQTPQQLQQQIQQLNSSSIIPFVMESPVSSNNKSNNSSSKPLSKTPPWRRNSTLLNSSPAIVVTPTSGNNSSNLNIPLINVTNERVPPLPQQHFIPQELLQQQQQLQQQVPRQQLLQHQSHGLAAWQQDGSMQALAASATPSPQPPTNRQITKIRANNVNSKKRPTFKEDPTGYLNQQTALLQNSISTLHSPDGGSTSPQDMNSITLSPSTNKTTIIQTNNNNHNNNSNLIQNVQISNQNNTSSNNIANQNTQFITLQSQQQLPQHQSQQQQIIHQQNVNIRNAAVNAAIQESQQQMISVGSGQKFLTSQNLLGSNNSNSTNNNNNNNNNSSNNNLNLIQIQRTDNSDGFSNTNRLQQCFQSAVVQQQQQQQQQQTTHIFNASNQQQLQAIANNSNNNSNNTQLIRQQIVTMPVTQQHLQQQQQQLQNNPGSVMVNGSATEDDFSGSEQEGTTISLPNSTTIGGQTVTHMPNGMVQVQQNTTQFKHQQQLQLQQQIQQQNQLIRQNQQLQMIRPKEMSQQQAFIDDKLRQFNAAQQESPVSSSTTFNSSRTPDLTSSSSTSSTPDLKGPVQAGAISTSHESPRSNPSPSTSPESIAFTQSKMLLQTPISLSFSVPGQTTIKNTVTSVVAGKSLTATTTSVSSNNYKMIAQSDNININDGLHTTKQQQQQQQQQHQQQQQQLHQQQQLQHQQQQQQQQQQQSHINQSVQIQSCVPVGTTNLANLNMQQIVRNDGASQIIMTSSGQIILMPSQQQPQHQQHLDQQQQQHQLNQRNTVTNQNLIINNNSTILNQHHHHHNTTNNTTQFVSQNNNLIIQPHNATNCIPHQHQAGQQQQPNHLNQSQSTHNNIITTNNSNFIMNATQQPTNTVILNNTNALLTNNGSILQQANGNGTTKIITTNAANSHHPNAGLLGQQQILTLSNGGIVIQPNFTTVDGHQVVLNQDGTQYIQHQPQQRQIILSPETKKKGKKRKASVLQQQQQQLQQQQMAQQQLQQSTIQQQLQLSPTTLQHQATQGGTMLHITPQYSPQSFQLSPGISGLALLPNKQTQQPQQQILLQNGQTLIQPLNILGQQLLVPAGLVVTPDAQLVQIQNMGSCGSIITPQGMVIRAQSPPQQKQFLTSNQGQQFVINGNGQISPIGQIYNTQLTVMPTQQTQQPQIIHQQQAQQQQAPQQTNLSSFVQQNTTIVQQQTTLMNNPGTTITNSGSDNCLNVAHSVSTQTAQAQNHMQQMSSPPDTTTHSPTSPERPASEKSGGSNDSISMAMVQCVSSSEPDSVVSPQADSAQSPSNLEYFDRNTGITYQQTVYKPSDAKIRRMQTPTSQFTNNNVISQGNQMTNNIIRPDSHESTSPVSSPSSSTTTPPTTQPQTMGGAAGSPTMSPAAFNIGDLVWGAVRGHPAWPGKIINFPSTATTTAAASSSSSVDSSGDCVMNGGGNGRGGSGTAYPVDSVWVRWFGGRPNAELVSVNGLKTLSEGLETHHKAQKDARKSRKLNSQLERAIQEAMAELDYAATTATTTVTPSQNKSNISNANSNLNNINSLSNINNNRTNNNNNNSNKCRNKYQTASLSSAIAKANASAANAATATTTTTNSSVHNNNGNGNTNGSIQQTNQRSKPIKIAPAPPQKRQHK